MLQIEKEHRRSTLMSSRKKDLVDQIMYLEHNNNVLNRTLDIQATNFLQLNKWIPVEERLPGTERVLITNGEFVKEGYCRPDGIWKYGRRENELFSNLSSKGVIAWMPLPEPYNPQK